MYQVKVKYTKGNGQYCRNFCDKCYTNEIQRIARESENADMIIETMYIKNSETDLVCHNKSGRNH